MQQSLTKSKTINKILNLTITNKMEIVWIWTDGLWSKTLDIQILILAKQKVFWPNKHKSQTNTATTLAC